jgi:hypothetical protein
MKNLIRHFAITALVLAAWPALSQQHRASPHETVGAQIDGSRITIVYGRPYTKDPRSGEIRKIWGGLVPYGKVWRLGADEATLLVTQKPLVFGETTIPAGAYTLYMLPDDNGPAKLIISKQIGQWGTVYDEKQDLARIELKKEEVTEPVDEFTIAISRSSSGGGVLKLSWEKSAYSAVFSLSK